MIRLHEVSVKQQSRFETFGLCELTNVDPARNRKRYYCIAVQPGLFDLILQRRWGRIGGSPRVKEEFYRNISEAVKRANRLYREKIRKGYRELL